MALILCVLLNRFLFFDIRGIALVVWHGRHHVLIWSRAVGKK